MSWESLQAWDSGAQLLVPLFLRDFYVTNAGIDPGVGFVGEWVGVAVEVDVGVMVGVSEEVPVDIPHWRRLRFGTPSRPGRATTE